MSEQSPSKFANIANATIFDPSVQRQSKEFLDQSKEDGEVVQAPSPAKREKQTQSNRDEREDSSHIMRNISMPLQKHPELNKRKRLQIGGQHSKIKLRYGKTGSNCHSNRQSRDRFDIVVVGCSQVFHP